jgi:predicted AAA+ superfamily ATPase
MDLAKKNGLMEVYIGVIIKREKNKEKGLIIGLMEAIMTGIGNKIRYQDMVNILGLTVENMQEIGDFNL